MTVDLDLLRRWIGRTEDAQDWLTLELARRFVGTLSEFSSLHHQLALGRPAPPGIHWCLAPPAADTTMLGADGHLRRGGFIPPVPLARRMWAAGSMELHDPLRIGDLVHRRSTIEDVSVKQGRSGALCLVRIHHTLSTERGFAIDERQDLVFRDAAPGVEPTMEIHESQGYAARPITLFRYSALTFNAHRIHYDREYAAAEGYPHLIVHGPLQATILLLRAVESLAGAVLRRFSFRAENPLFCNEGFEIAIDPVDRQSTLAIVTARGRVRTMTAVADTE